MILIAGCMFMTSGLYAQDTSDKEIISGDELKEVLEDVRSWTAESIEFLKIAKDLTTQEIVAQANAIRVKFDPLMVLMATTDPEAEYQQAAIMLLMGAKGVELALWHYIYAVLGNSQEAKDHGDELLGAAVSQLNDAKELFLEVSEQESE